MNLAVQNNALVVPGSEALARVFRIQDEILSHPQIDIPTEHILHGGMYARTIRLKGGVIVTGAHFKVPSILIVKGKCAVSSGESAILLCNYHVLTGEAGRKQVCVTMEDTEITMIFRTDAKTVEEAENEFTDEAESLMSRKQDGNNIMLVTGE